MTKAGADIIVAHMGVTTGGTIGATSAKSLDDCVKEIDAIAAAARVGAQGRDRALPWRADRDAGRRALHPRALHRPAWLLRRSSSMERLPAEAAIREPDGGFQGADADAGRKPELRSDGELTTRHSCEEERHEQGTNFVYPKDVDAFGFDWGRLALTVAPEVNGAARFSGGVVDLPTGQGHTRHNHPGAEEIIFVISGNGEQMVEDDERQSGRAEGRPRLHDLRAGKPLPLDAQHRRRADAALRRLFAGRAGAGAARSAGFQAAAAGRIRPRRRVAQKAAGFGLAQRICRARRPCGCRSEESAVSPGALLSERPHEQRNTAGAARLRRLLVEQHVDQGAGRQPHRLRDRLLPRAAVQHLHRANLAKEEKLLLSRAWSAPGRCRRSALGFHRRRTWRHRLHLDPARRSLCARLPRPTFRHAALALRSEGRRPPAIVRCRCSFRRRRPCRAAAFVDWSSGVSRRSASRLWPRSAWS